MRAALAPPASGHPESAECVIHDPFIAWVLRRAEIDPSGYRPASLVRRLPACLRAVKARTPKEGREKLTRQPELLAAALSALLIGVTEFFRDRAVYENLERVLLSRLVSKSRPLRIWSAACSNGAELYSVAILLAEMGVLDRCELLGTDCRPSAIAEAQKGVFAAAAAATIPAPFVDRYFNVDGQVISVAEPLRQRITWRESDFFRNIEPGDWDLILWRNVAMYLTFEVSSYLWQCMEMELAPGGVLVVGKAEQPPRGCRLEMVKPCIYEKKGMIL